MVRDNGTRILERSPPRIFLAALKPAFSVSCNRLYDSVRPYAANAIVVGISDVDIAFGVDGTTGWGVQARFNGGTRIAAKPRTPIPAKVSIQ